LRGETAIGEHLTVGLLKCCVVDSWSGPWLLWPETHQSRMRETFDILLVETQFIRQTLAVHARELRAMAQMVDFDWDFEQYIVRVLKPLGEPFDPPRHQQVTGLSISAWIRAHVPLAESRALTIR
jgi:hypothetical protein